MSRSVPTRMRGRAAWVTWATGLLAGTVLLGGGADAQQEVPSAGTTAPPGDVKSYWTPERMREAQPMENHPSSPPPPSGEAPLTPGPSQERGGKPPRPDPGDER